MYRCPPNRGKANLHQPPFRDQPSRAGAGATLVAPLRVGDRLVGILAATDAEAARTYTPDEVALAGAVAHLAALVIEWERLVGEREAAQASALALQEANRRMDEFLSIAAHELKTPLVAILASTQGLARRLNGKLSHELEAEPHRRVQEAAAPLLATTERGVYRLNRLVDDLLDVSRIREGKLELRLASCDLASIVREATEDQRSVQATRAIRMQLPPATRPVPMVADADCIEQVVTNYLTNALKYSPEDQPVVVCLEVDGETARVAVTDHGPGLPRGEQERIWQQFYRAEGIRVQSGSGVGLGLGLHICKTIVERHGGQVGVESAVGQGATFWFTLPLAAAAPS